MGAEFRPSLRLLVVTAHPDDEALALGGQMDELRADGRIGLVVKNAEEMAEAIRRVGEIDPAVCRAEAEARFSAARMVGGYMELYGECVLDAAGSWEEARGVEAARP